MAYNTRRNQRRGRGRGSLRPLAQPTRMSDSDTEPHSTATIVHGVEGVRLNACMLNAHLNALDCDARGIEARVVVGSMGFRSDDGEKTHWEFGGAGWNKAYQFRKTGGLAWDAHAWVVHTNSDGREVIIDPYFSEYAGYAKLWGIKTRNPSKSRVYRELGGKEGDRLFDSMVEATLRLAKPGDHISKTITAWRRLNE